MALSIAGARDETWLVRCHPRIPLVEPAQLWRAWPRWRRPRALALSGKPSALSTDQKPNSFEEITNYNNFYEFGFGKEDPARYAGALTIDPWSIEIGGLVDRPAAMASRIWPPNPRWRNASTACAVSRRGRW